MPQCLIVSGDDCGLRELLEFTTRQLKITRVYAAHLWKAILLGSSQFLIVFGGIALALSGRGWVVCSPTRLCSRLFVLVPPRPDSLNAVQLALADYNLSLRKSLPAHLLLWPFAPVLFLCNAIAAGFPGAFGGAVSITN